MTRFLDDRLQSEIRHGRTTTALKQAESGWNSSAGRVRRQRRADFLVRGLPRSTRILEVGAGTGLQTIALIQSFDDVVAIDISAELLEVARRRAPGASYRVMDAHRPDFPDGSFDAIVGVSILHHLDWDYALSNYLRLLRPGGLLRFSEPNLVNPQIFLQKNIPWIKRLAGDSPDEYAFSKWRIGRSLATAGYLDISITPFEFLHPSTPMRLISLILKIEEFVSRTRINEIAGSLLIQGRKP
jgi:SAM-dependent methyltransferase